MPLFLFLRRIAPFCSALLFAFPGVVSAREIFLLVDSSGSVQGFRPQYQRLMEGFLEGCKALREGKEGVHLELLATPATFGSASPRLALELEEYSGFKHNPGRFRTARADRIQRFLEEELPGFFQSLPPSAKVEITPLFALLSSAVQRFGGSPPRSLFLFSDMVEESELLNMRKDPPGKWREKVQKSPLYREVREGLKGVRIYVRSEYDPRFVKPKLGQEIAAFWQGFFKEAGAWVGAFSPDADPELLCKELSP